MTEAMWVDENGKIGNIYIPARKKGSEMGAEQPVSVLVKVNDAALRSFLEKSRDVEKKSEAEQDAFLVANIDKLQIARTFKVLSPTAWMQLIPKIRRQSNALIRSSRVAMSSCRKAPHLRLAGASFCCFSP
jgi:hypothetical protein